MCDKICRSSSLSGKRTTCSKTGVTVFERLASWKNSFTPNTGTNNRNTCQSGKACSFQTGPPHGDEVTQTGNRAISRPWLAVPFWIVERAREIAELKSRKLERTGGRSLLAFLSLRSSLAALCVFGFGSFSAALSTIHKDTASSLDAFHSPESNWRVRLGTVRNVICKLNNPKMVCDISEEIRRTWLNIALMECALSLLSSVLG